MARKKQLPDINFVHENLPEEIKVDAEAMKAEYRTKNIRELREEAKKLHVESPTTLAKEELIKRMVDKRIALLLPPEYIQGCVDTVIGRENITGIYDDADGEFHIGDVIVPSELSESLGLRSGDLVQGIAVENKTSKTLLKVNSIDSESLNAPRPWFCKLVPTAQGRDFGVADNPIGAKIPDLKMGERVMASGMSLDEAIGLTSSHENCVGLFFGITAENMPRMGSGNFAVAFDDSQRIVLRKARLALNRAKRLSERGKDVILVVYGFEYISDRDMERALFGAGRCFDQGSITVIADVKKDKDGGIYEKAATRKI